MTDQATTGPASAVVVLRYAVGVGDGPRLRAELDGRMAVGTQELIIDTEEVRVIGPDEVSILANAATRLREAHSGSMVLRHPSVELLGQLRLMHLDQKFELET